MFINILKLSSYIKCACASATIHIESLSQNDEDENQILYEYICYNNEYMTICILFMCASRRFLKYLYLYKVYISFNIIIKSKYLRVCLRCMGSI